MKKGVFVLCLLVLVLGVVGVVAYNMSIPDPGHGADQVSVNINGKDTSLQGAINDKSIITGNVIEVSDVSGVGHSGSEILIEINGKETDLESAIPDEFAKLCGPGESSCSFGDKFSVTSEIFRGPEKKYGNCPPGYDISAGCNCLDCKEGYNPGDIKCIVDNYDLGVGDIVLKGASCESYKLSNKGTVTISPPRCEFVFNCTKIN